MMPARVDETAQSTFQEIHSTQCGTEQAINSPAYATMVGLRKAGDEIRKINEEHVRAGEPSTPPQPPKQPQVQFATPHGQAPSMDFAYLKKKNSATEVSTSAKQLGARCKDLAPCGTPTSARRHGGGGISILAW